jgi:hypothetical protein
LKKKRRRKSFLHSARVKIENEGKKVLLGENEGKKVLLGENLEGMWVSAFHRGGKKVNIGRDN